MSMADMNIIPSPQKIECELSGNTLLGEFGVREIDGLAAETFEFVKRDFPGDWRMAGAGGFHARLTRGGAAAIPPVVVPEKPDAYILRVTPDGVGIDANDSAGLWYGLQSLFQMADGRGEIPVCEINDHAAVRRRGVHWDLKGYQPKFNVLMEEFRRLAQYKVNMVLLELEDKYDYRCAPDVGVPGAYTFAQLRALSCHAAALGMVIVPKLQCLGHVDYLLKHPRYRHLREAGHPYQYCPRSDEAFALWQAMARELMDCFAEHRGFFHVGADETDKLGVCPECARHSKADSYIFHVSRCLDFVIERGRVPIMWDDMLRDLHGGLGPEDSRRARSLGAKAILNYWSYGYGGKNNNFGFLPVYLGQGAKVWGASGFSGNDNWAGSLPPLEIRAKNIDAWTKSAIENNLEAVIATGWTRIASGTPPTEPHETSWFTSLYAAESMWSGKPRDYNAFIDALSLRLYGRRLSPSLSGSVLNIAKTPFPSKEIEHRFDGIPLLAALQYAAAAESFANSLNELVACRRMFHGQLGEIMPDYMINSRRKMLKRFRDESADLEAGCRKWLGEFYEAGTVDDFIRTRFGYCREYAEEFSLCIDRTKEL